MADNDTSTVASNSQPTTDDRRLVIGDDVSVSENSSNTVITDAPNASEEAVFQQVPTEQTAGQLDSQTVSESELSSVPIIETSASSEFNATNPETTMELTMNNEQVTNNNEQFATEQGEGIEHDTQNTVSPESDVELVAENIQKPIAAEAPTVAYEVPMEPMTDNEQLTMNNEQVTNNNEQLITEQAYVLPTDEDQVQASEIPVTEISEVSNSVSENSESATPTSVTDISAPNPNAVDLPAFASALPNQQPTTDNEQLTTNNSLTSGSALPASTVQEYLDHDQKATKSFFQKFFKKEKKELKEDSNTTAAKMREAEKIYQQGLASIKDLIAPSSFEVLYNRIQLSGVHARSFFVYAYPRYLDTNWLSPVVNFDATFDLAQFIYPISSAEIMKILRRKVAQIQSSIDMQREKGMVRDPVLETALEDAESLRTDIQRGQEKFFQFGMYVTVYAEDEKKLEAVTKQLESLLGGKLVLTKRTDIRGEHAFNSTLPLAIDELEVIRNMNTSPLSTTFPFVSSTLTSDDGILYGLNRHNNSLIIFDRFKLPNANSVVFATSGAGKSYAVKLEILRTLMFGTDVIVIDPENEYEALAEVVGGSYLRVSLTSDQRINPFDLPRPFEGDETKPGDLLRSNIITLTGLMRLMLGKMTTSEEALVDKALIETYAVRGITLDTENPGAMASPTMEDFHSVLSSMRGAESLAERVQKFTTGTFGGIFNKPTNVNLASGLVVFCIRDLEEILRPIAIYILLNYIWNCVRSEMKRRMLVVDEAWTMMAHEDSAKFMYGLVKRARKYYLGITTITQDVEDFMSSPYGKPIVTNSAMQLLLKQSPSAMDTLQKVFNLTDGEKYMLINSGVGQGLFFAGNKHVAIQIIASYSEHQTITTNPEEKMAQRAKAEAEFEG